MTTQHQDKDTLITIELAIKGKNIEAIKERILGWLDNWYAEDALPFPDGALLFYEVKAMSTSGAIFSPLKNTIQTNDH